MGEAYLDYAMSTIVSRAIPDVRDGLKPVQRRILYAMQDLGARSNSQFRKCARIVGETMGKYHPHGEAAIYDGLARMAQPFSLRYMPVEGQGNFGSVDGDPPAAMRYTEARLSRLAEEMLADIDRDTVDFAENFDSSAEEPLVLPAKAPNLLINGASGIAVGMATNIPPNNFREIADAVNALLENPDLSGDELSKIVLGPDFPTGAIISAEGIRSAYGTGRGRILVRALVNPEESREGRNLLVVSELPYQVNKAKLTEKIATLVRSKTIEGISDIRDESDREGMRLVIELRRDAYPTKVLNQLYKHTALQTTFGVNMTTLVDGQPRTVSLREALQEFIKHREEVVTRRARFDLLRALDRAHVLEGFLTALDNIDEVVAIIRASETTDDARAALMERFDLSEIQANAILDMQLRRLVALEAQKLRDELAELRKRIAELEALLADMSIVHGVIREETLELRERFGDARRTRIVNITGELTDEDLIPDEDCVVTITRRGYAKRQPTDTFRIQGRGGKGIRGLVVKDDEIPALPRHQEPRSHTRVHQPRPRVQAQMLRASTHEPRSARRGDGQPSPARTPRASHGAHSVPEFRGWRAPPDGHAEGRRQADRAHSIRLGAVQWHSDHEPEAQGRVGMGPAVERRQRGDVRHPAGHGDPLSRRRRPQQRAHQRRRARDATPRRRRSGLDGPHPRGRLFAGRHQ